MPFVTLRRLLDGAEAGNYAVGAFNANNLEAVQAIIAAAEELASPAIIQASQGAIKYAGLEYLVAMVRTGAERARVPIALHLDHGTDYDTLVRCIRAGFTSVMFDGSQWPHEENTARTREIVRIAHAAGVSVEGEIGRIGGVEDDVKVDERDAQLTPVEDAVAFYRATGVDALAMSFGTAHGHYKLPPRLAFDRIDAVHRATGAYLVMHGGSGVPDAGVQQGIRLGIRKVNIDTDLRAAFVTGLRLALGQQPQEMDPRKVLGPARQAMKEKVQDRMRVFGSAGQAG